MERQTPRMEPPRATWAIKAIALALIVLVGWLNIPRTIPSTERQALADKFRFERTSLNDVLEAEVLAAEPLVAPRFQHLESWLTAFLPTGAALADLDNDGLFDEACTTDGFSRKVRLHQLPVDGGELSSIELPLPVEEYGVEGVIPSGCLPGDFNEDGRTDLLIYFWGRTPVIFVNQGGEFDESNFQMVEAVKPVGRWYTQSMTQGDVDGDGDLDLLVGCYFPDDAKILNDAFEGESFMNKGLGASFNGEINRLLLRKDALVEDEPWFDLEEDLFRSPDVGGAQWTIAVAAADLDGDLLPEMIFLNDHGTDRILHNRSAPGSLDFALLKNDRDLVTTKSSTFGRDDYHAMGVDFADLNQDGHIDWTISNFGADYLFHQSHFVWMNSGNNELYKQNKAPFRDEGETLGLARTAGVPWDVRCVDFDNDGKLEIYRSIGFMRGNVNRMPEAVEMGMINDVVFQYPEAWHKFGKNDSLVGKLLPNAFFAWAGEHYVDIGADLELYEEGQSRGMSSGDVDNDGRIDFLVTNQRSSSSFYKNNSKSGQFLGLDLRLVFDAADCSKIRVESIDGSLNTRPSRPAIGASVKVELPKGKKFASFVDGGSGSGGKRVPRIHFGLGSAVQADDLLPITIRWRDQDGNAQQASLELKPGWHRVWLGE